MPGAEGVVHLTASGACSWYEFTARDHGQRPASRCRSSRLRTDDRAGRRRPAAQRRAGAVHAPTRSGSRRFAAWQEGLERLHAAARALAGRARSERRRGSMMQRLETRARGPDPDRAARPRRRARLLLRDLPPQRLRGARDSRGDGAGQPLALGQGDRARHALPDRRRRGEARSLRARRDLRRRRRPAPRLADVRGVGGLSS